MWQVFLTTFKFDYSSLILNNPFNNPSNNKKQRKASMAKDSKSYSIGYDKITFVGRLADPKYSDILTCIVRNSNSSNKNTTLYLHAFRCDAEESAKKMEQYLNYFRKSYFKKIERQQLKQRENLIKQNTKLSANQRQHNQNEQSKLKENFLKRQIFKISDHFQGNTNSSGGTQSSTSQNEVYYSPINSPRMAQSHYSRGMQSARSQSPQPKAFSNDIHREIATKIEAGEPLLFPPKDYSEVNRKRGDLSERENRRCLNEKIVGEQALKYKKNPAILEDNEPENELYLNLSSTSNKLETEINTSRSADFNSLSFNEQATQVLNYLDEIVDSVDSIYKPPIPIDSSRNMYKYEPPEEKIYQRENNVQYTPRQQEAYYEPYEPLNDNGSSHVAPKSRLPRNYSEENNYHVKKNPLHIINEDKVANVMNKSPFQSSFLKRTPVDNDHYYAPKKVEQKSKKVKNIEKQQQQQQQQQTQVKRMFSIKSPSTENESVYSAANVGIRNNVLPVLGNYTPKMYGNGNALAGVQSGSTQIIYRKIKDTESSNKENHYHKIRSHALSDEQIYKKPSQNPEYKNYDLMNHSLSNLDDYGKLNDNKTHNNQKKTPNRNNKGTTTVYQNFNSQFILKPPTEDYDNHQNFKNYVQVEDLKNYKTPVTARSAGTLIDVYSSSGFKQPRRNQQVKGNATSRSYEINDIYY